MGQHVSEMGHISSVQVRVGAEGTKLKSPGFDQLVRIDQGTMQGIEGYFRQNDVMPA